MRIAVAGAGLIGSRRAHIAQADADTTVAVVVDTDVERARALAAEIGCEWSTDWRSALERARPDACVVATPHKYLTPLTVLALDAGCHVLCEKPLGRTPDEAFAAVTAARTASRVLKTGFNLRYHAGIRKAHEVAMRGSLGDLMHIRCRYGHGGRPGYDREWRGDPELSGGGELIDQGIHVLDLFRWFLGDFDAVRGFISKAFWVAGGVEDNVFALLRTPSGQIGLLHASWTQWRNLFSLEVFGRDGYVIVDGLGGSYGPEVLTYGRRDPTGGSPREERIPVDPEDPWRAEWRAFVATVRGGRDPAPSGEDGWRALMLAHEIYREARR